MTTTALFLLRCKQIGFTIEDLDYLSLGAIYDVFIEFGNDEVDYKPVATQEDFDKF